MIKGWKEMNVFATQPGTLMIECRYNKIMGNVVEVDRKLKGEVDERGRGRCNEMATELFINRAEIMKIVGNFRWYSEIVVNVRKYWEILVVIEVMNNK